MDLGPAVLIGFALFIVPIALDQHDQKMKNLPANGFKSAMRGRGTRPKI